jgi:hypothetical protein
MLRKLLPLSIALLLCSCSTKYSSMSTDNGMGYWERPIDSTTWEVRFIANKGTEMPLVNRYVLYRSAELTSARGFDYFVVLDYSNSTSGSFLGDVNVHPAVNSSPCIPIPPLAAPGPTVSFDPGTHAAVVTMRMYHGNCPTNDLHDYDAKFVISSMGPSIARGD